MNKIFLYIIIFILIISNAFFLLHHMGVNKNKLISSQIESALIKTQMDSYSLIGKNVKFIGIEKFFNDNIKRNIGNSPTLFLIFNEFGCNVCQEAESRFALEIAKMYGHNKVAVIIRSDNLRYIQSFIRINRIDFDIYYCSDNHFFEINEIIHTPLLIVTDEVNRIIAAHIPISGNPQYSGPFHFFCRDYFTRMSSKMPKMGLDNASL